jgi:ATP phosphoribosyltransferase
MEDSLSLLPPCRFAIPKKGRLYEKCEKMLAGAGIEYRREARLDVAVCKDLALTLVFLPASDIANYVGLGDVDLGITGDDHVQESGVDVDTVLRLGFGKCRLCVQAPVKLNVTDVAQLSGSRVCTSFPELTTKYFADLDSKTDKKTSVRFVSGSVEAACGLGLADAVVDLVETGTTMKAAGLEIVAELMSTEALLIANKNSKHKDTLTLIKRRIEGYITATKYMMISFNVARRLLNDAIKITPGKSSPTVTGLENSDFCSVSALILKSESATKMDELEVVGATDILLFSLANSRM